MLRVIADTIRKGPQGHIDDWVPRSPDPKHLAVLEKECSNPSDFDEILSKQTLYKNYKEGRLEPYVCEHRITKDVIIALFPESNQALDVPWALWSQIVQLFRHNTPHTIFLLAHQAKRHFPPYGKPVRPLHINGGYTYPCTTDCVFIFRAEDATRVLIHELFHSNCCDNTALHLEEREAETEAWAELFWCGLISQGNPSQRAQLSGRRASSQTRSAKRDLKTFKSLVIQQGSLIRTQNRLLREGHHFEAGPMGFPWRYTIGKEDLWRKWGLLESTTDRMKIGDSMRLTLHLPIGVKQRFGVSEGSTIL
jgi:hypothetical protein